MGTAKVTARRVETTGRNGAGEPPRHLARAEHHLLQAGLLDMVAAAAGQAATVVDVGPFAGRMARALAGGLERPKAFFLIDQDAEALARGRDRLAPEAPGAEVRVLVGDLARDALKLPRLGAGRRIAALGGGALNLLDAEARARLLDKIGGLLRPGDFLAALVEPPGDAAAKEALHRDALLARARALFPEVGAGDWRVWHMPDPPRVEAWRLGPDGAARVTGLAFLSPAMLEAEAAAAGLAPVRVWTSADGAAALALFKQG
jgi:uncharacterized SAM-dependent methyltransferase